MVSVSQTIYLIHKPICYLTWQKLGKNRFVLSEALIRLALQEKSFPGLRADDLNLKEKEEK